MNVVIMSRTKVTLDQVAEKISKMLLLLDRFTVHLITDGNVQDSADSTFSFFIGNTTGKKVKVIVTDFTKEDVFSEIVEQLKDLNIGVLGWISSII